MHLPRLSGRIPHQRLVMLHWEVLIHDIEVFTLFTDSVNIMLAMTRLSFIYLFPQVNLLRTTKPA